MDLVPRRGRATLVETATVENEPQFAVLSDEEMVVIHRCPALNDDAVPKERPNVIDLVRVAEP